MKLIPTLLKLLIVFAFCIPLSVFAYSATDHNQCNPNDNTQLIKSPVNNKSLYPLCHLCVDNIELGAFNYSADGSIIACAFRFGAHPTGEFSSEWSSLCESRGGTVVPPNPNLPVDIVSCKF